MRKQKIIAFITSMPESVYTQRSFDGIFEQCNKYGYDVAVFSSLIHISESVSLNKCKILTVLMQTNSLFQKHLLFQRK